MKRLLPILFLIVAVAVAAAAGWLLLQGEPAPAVAPAPPAIREMPVRGPPKEAALPEFAPEAAPVNPPGEGDEAREVPLPPDAYPWEVPAWWHEVDRKFREKEVVVDEEVRTVKDLLLQLGRDVGFPVKAGPELAEWEDSRMSFPSTRGQARTILEALAYRTNLEIVLTADALTLRQRGREKEDRVSRAGRVQAAIEESIERRAGRREPDPATGEFVATAVDVPLDGVALREAARIVGERTSVPVYMDASLWASNLPVKVEAGERPLSKVLDALVAPSGAAWDATPRRVILFKPAR